MTLDDGMTWVFGERDIHTQTRKLIRKGKNIFGICFGRSSGSLAKKQCPSKALSCKKGYINQRQNRSNCWAITQPPQKGDTCCCYFWLRWMWTDLITRRYLKSYWECFLPCFLDSPFYKYHASMTMHILLLADRWTFCWCFFCIKTCPDGDVRQKQEVDSMHLSSVKL